MNRALFAGVIVSVLAALAAGFAVVGGPGFARSEANDAQRMNDLRNLASRLRCDLPAADSTVQTQGNAPLLRCIARANSKEVTDPLTGEAYVIRTPNADVLEVCAQFETDVSGKTGSSFERLHLEGRQGCLRYQRIAANGQWRAD